MPAKEQFRLYVWTEPYQVSYGGSIVFAIARNLEEAKATAKIGTKWSFGQFDDGPMNWPHDLGEPTRVLGLPCAEWYHWEE